jgi:hypothetical protein
MLAPRRTQTSPIIHYVAPIAAMVLAVMLIISLP